MIDITYIVADATNPQGTGKKILIHICNTINAWGAGFVVPLARKWPITKRSYHEWYQENLSLTLGTIQAVQVEKDIVVINMIGQEGIGGTKDNPPIRYEAVRECLQKVRGIALEHNASVHAPYLMGAGLAGGDWNTIERIIIEELSDYDVSVTLYDIENKRQI